MLKRISASIGNRLGGSRVEEGGNTEGTSSSHPSPLQRSTESLPTRPQPELPPRSSRPPRRLAPQHLPHATYVTAIGVVKETVEYTESGRPVRVGRPLDDSNFERLRKAQKAIDLTREQMPSRGNVNVDNAKVKISTNRFGVSKFRPEGGPARNWTAAGETVDAYSRNREQQGLPPANPMEKAAIFSSLGHVGVCDTMASATFFNHAENLTPGDHLFKVGNPNKNHSWVEIQKQNANISPDASDSKHDIIISDAWARKTAVFKTHAHSALFDTPGNAPMIVLYNASPKVTEDYKKELDNAESKVGPLYQSMLKNTSLRKMNEFPPGYIWGNTKVISPAFSAEVKARIDDLNVSAADPLRTRKTISGEMTAEIVAVHTARRYPDVNVRGAALDAAEIAKNLKNLRDNA